MAALQEGNQQSGTNRVGVLSQVKRVWGSKFSLRPSPYFLRVAIPDHSPRWDCLEGFPGAESILGTGEAFWNDWQVLSRWVGGLGCRWHSWWLCRDGILSGGDVWPGRISATLNSKRGEGGNKQKSARCYRIYLINSRDDAKRHIDQYCHPTWLKSIFWTGNRPELSMHYTRMWCKM